MQDAIIRTEFLTFRYPGEDQKPGPLALDSIDLEIEKGDFVAILGHNGSGKSTLARHLNAILLPSGGKVYISGMDTVDAQLLQEIRRRVGVVFQNPDNQIVASVVEEDVAFAPENLGLPPAEIRRRVDEALKIVDMYDYRAHAPHRLSGGQKQRVAIAGVIAMRPDCIVLDEPTAMLDPKGRGEVLTTIETLNRDFGITIILITHRMEETINARRLIVMNDGKIEMDGPPAEVFPQVERLHTLGLSVPETTELIWRLRQQGLDLPLDALTPEDCAAAIYSHFDISQP